MPPRRKVKGAKTWFRHAAARWYSWRSPPSRSRRSIAACGGGWRWRLGRERRVAAERAVWALGVVVVDVDAQDAVELARSEDQQPVQALRSVRSARSARRARWPAATRNGVWITLTPSVRKTSSKPATNFVSRSRIRNLTSSSAPERLRLRACWVTQRPSGFAVIAGEVHAAGLQLDEEQHVVAAQQGGLDGEEVARDDARRLRAQELTPARPRAPWRRSEAGACEQPANRARRDRQRRAC